MGKLTERELAAVLAGLRLLQEAGELPSRIEAIYTHDGFFEGLGHEEIDVLCERLNQ